MNTDYCLIQFKLAFIVVIRFLNNVSPLIGLTNKTNKTLKSFFVRFPAGFEYVGPRIRIPRAKSVYIAGWKRLETPSLVKQSRTLVLNKFLKT